MRPSWINEVKEVDEDEARVLVALGLPCWYDCHSKECPYDDKPFSTFTRAEHADRGNPSWKEWEYWFYYTTLGESLEQ